MMQTLNPYNNTAKTAEIMARYRPIAPKPEAPSNPNDENGSSVPRGIRKSPYLMNVWNHLQARPTRTRKRGRTALGPPALKRTRTCGLQVQGFSAPNYNLVTGHSPARTLALQGFVHDPTALPSISFLPNLLPLKCGLETPVTTTSNTVSLPLMPSAPAPGGTAVIDGSELLAGDDHEGGRIDLNKEADVPQEVDFMHQLESPKKVSVISPQAIRPVGSSISVGIITEDPCRKNPGKKAMKKKKPEEVEKEMEFEELPAVVSDSNNRVRLTNAAYNEMVGQPECPWLDFTSSGGGACKRIGGEVVLDFVNSGNKPKLTSSDGFNCRVRIEWGKGGKKNVVNAFSDVTRLACDSKDYLFEWRFHIRDHDQTSESGSNV